MVLQSKKCPQPNRSRSESKESHLSSIRRYVARRRCWLVSAAVLLFAVMAVGIVFAAHQYFVDFGGQGWLKTRDEGVSSSSVLDVQIYLPMRQVEVFQQMGALSWRSKRSPQDDVPYYTCGDQQNSCEAYGQPNICCPVLMYCYVDTSLPSGVYCCNATGSRFNCNQNRILQPSCMAGLMPCSKATGGGCCPSQMECSPNGCVHVYSASTLSTTAASSASSANGGSTSASEQSTSRSYNGVSGTPITVTSTVIQVPGATVTLAKTGQVAEEAAGRRAFTVMEVCLPYVLVWAFVCTAAFMAML